MEVFYVTYTKYLYAIYLFASYLIIFLIFACIFRYFRYCLYFQTVRYLEVFTAGFMMRREYMIFFIQIAVRFIQPPVPALFPLPRINLTA